MSGIFANKIVSLVILGVILVGLVAGVVLVRQQQILKSRAAGEEGLIQGDPCTTARLGCVVDGALCRGTWDLDSNTCQVTDQDSQCDSCPGVVTGQPISEATCSNGRKVGEYWPGVCDFSGKRIYMACNSDLTIGLAFLEEDSTCVAEANPPKKTGGNVGVSSCQDMTCRYSERTSGCPSKLQWVTGTGCSGDNCQGCDYVGGCSQTSCIPPSTTTQPGGTGSSGGNGIPVGDNPPNAKRPCDNAYTWKALAPGTNGAPAVDAKFGLRNGVAVNGCSAHSDCPQNSADPQNVNASSSNWCYEFGVGNRCIQLQHIPGQTCAGGGGGGGDGCSGNACNDCILKNRTDILPFYQQNGWDTGCGNQTKIVENWCGIDASGCRSVKASQCSSQCGVTAPSQVPSQVPSTAPAVTTVAFRVAENPADFAETGPTGWQAYTAAGMTVPHDFRTAGQKNIFVEFKDSTGKVSRHNAQIKVLGPDPAITSCSVSFEGSNTILNLTGQNFGAVKGLLKSGETDLQIRSWRDTSVQAVWPNAPTGQNLPVLLTNSDGQTGAGQCSAVSQISVGAKVFCRQPSAHDTDNVDLVLAGLFEGGTKTRQKVKIDKDGIIQGLTQKLEAGKKYKLSLKAPKSLRRTSKEFTAAGGITQIPDFVLPVGDIFPADGGDGKINALDKAELNRQWIIAQDTTGRSADFNKDSRVNSVDWACMRVSMPDAVSGDDPEPESGPVSSRTPAGLGGLCGGIAGIRCASGLQCQMNVEEANNSDRSGTCVEAGVSVGATGAS